MFGVAKSDSTNENKTTSVDVYTTPLPPTMPVVKATVDSLVALAVKQRMFICSHADRVKLELVRERLRPSVAVGQWYLNGFAFSDEDAVDFIRQCPDALSNLTFRPFQDTGLWVRILSWFKRKPDVEGLNVVDDLAFVVSVAEAVELAGHVLGVVSYALSQQVPKVGNPLLREIAFELTGSKHRGNSHSMYLLVTLEEAKEKTGKRREAMTLQLTTALYIYEPGTLGGLTGVAVNISGLDTHDLPTADVNAHELKSILSKKGRFVAASTSDFLVKADRGMTSEQAVLITTTACDRLTSAANAALVSFFEDEATYLEEGRKLQTDRQAN